MWMIVSNLTLIIMRGLQFFGQSKSGTFDPEGAEEPLHEDENHRVLKNFKWEKSTQLRSLSYIITMLAFPFFVTWTIIGNVWISQSNIYTPNCVRQLISLLTLVAGTRPQFLYDFLVGLLLHSYSFFPHFDASLVYHTSKCLDIKEQCLINA